jgi:hypothetical protein
VFLPAYEMERGKEIIRAGILMLPESYQP